MARICFALRRACVRTFLILAAAGPGMLTAPASAQSLHSCEIGRRVRDPEGKTGVIVAAEYDPWCVIKLDAGGQIEHPYHVPDPAGPGAAPASAPLPSGEWDCSVSAGTYQHPTIRPMGRLEIRGLQYRFRPFGKVTDGFAPYSVGADGALRWGGHLGGLDRAPSRLVASRKTDSGLNVQFRVSPTAYVETMSCRRR